MEMLASVDDGVRGSEGVYGGGASSGMTFFNVMSQHTLSMNQTTVNISKRYSVMNILCMKMPWVSFITEAEQVLKSREVRRQKYPLSRSRTNSRTSYSAQNSWIPGSTKTRHVVAQDAAIPSSLHAVLVPVVCGIVLPGQTSLGAGLIC